MKLLMLITIAAGLAAAQTQYPVTGTCIQMTTCTLRGTATSPDGHAQDTYLTWFRDSGHDYVKFQIWDASAGKYVYDSGYCSPSGMQPFPTPTSGSFNVDWQCVMASAHFDTLPPVGRVGKRWLGDGIVTIP